MYVSIWDNKLDCPAPSSGTSTGATGKVIGSGCQNRVVPADSSIVVRASTASKYGYVSGYSEPDCHGMVIAIAGKDDGCFNLRDVTVQSWKSGQPFDRAASMTAEERVDASGVDINDA
jgi:hypothetical protein